VETLQIAWADDDGILSWKGVPLGAPGDGSDAVVLARTSLNDIDGVTAVEVLGQDVAVQANGAAYKVLLGVIRGTSDLIVIGVETQYEFEAEPPIEPPIEPPEGEIVPVAFHSASPVVSKNVASATWTHVVPEPPNAVLVLVGKRTTAQNPYRFNCGDVTMDQLGTAAPPNDFLQAEIYGLLNVPAGEQELAYLFTDPGGTCNVRLQSLCYTGVSAFGPVVTASGDSADPLVVVGEPLEHHMAAALFAFNGSPGVATPSLPTRTERGRFNSAANVGIETQDTTGEAQMDFGLTLSKETMWAALGLTLIPVGL